MNVIETQTQGPPWPVHTQKVPLWKRAMDLMGAIGLVIVLLPLWIPLAALTAVIMGRPIIFRQERGGHGGAKFQLMKLRTMRDLFDETGAALPDPERRHWFGDLVRKTSLDELPGLLNVIKGDMSLVGPRPLMAIYLERYNQEQAQRHQLRPGLTGLAQTKGRNDLTYEERFELDLEYVNSFSPLLDLKLLLATPKAVFGGEGADTTQTMFDPKNSGLGE